MSKIKIITDSNSGILQEEGKQLDLFVIPMPFTINGEEYFEEITMSQEQFFEHLAKGAEVTTSQPSQYYLEELWTELLKDYDELLYIPMSSGLSKTCENAQKLAENFNGKVFVVDNLRISVTQKESVFEALALAKQGKTAAEIKEYLESTKDKMSIYIVPAVLKYLKKGGRISPAAAMLGDILKVKPILYSNGLKFEKYGIALAMNQAKTKMIMKIKQDLETTFKQEYEAGKMTISVAHTQNEEEALKFKEEIMAKLPNVKFRFVDPLSLSVSCHIGAGALAVATCINNYLD
ncbi:MAG: DegV family protein [Clostridiales bacterium]|nr:DegV family protein [Clostridiales bacterium]